MFDGVTDGGTAMRRIHLDTDLGGDTDDLCALALLLGRPEVELTGITTCTEAGGLRAGLVEHALRLVGRSGIPVVAGAEGSLAGLRVPAGVADVERYWGEAIAPRPAPPGAALDLLASSVAAGATIVAIGPYTNLALLEAARPGSQAAVEVVLMGGYVTPIRPDLPQHGVDVDYNVQQDTAAARLVFERADPLLVQFPVCLDLPLRAACLPRLRAAGPLAALIARQAEAHGQDNQMKLLGRSHAGTPDDLLNFQYDPLACAIAAGWDGARIETLPLSAQIDDSLPLHDRLLAFTPHPAGKPTRVVMGVDAARFEHDWLAAVVGALTPNPPPNPRRGELVPPG